ncbi:uncharacterized protein LOC112044649 isoform X1 [Bicyclus anynana]|uniref:Uncharacterized protein LOC112044649 isoform X1 n=1 Tax=Bicyclus anynana TaxID=110368 RepID=A0A6J1MLB4_BICAN|nr:uncharacterized protein LOC112044649 isoform X1 [Bicyclus anynana]XP_023936318.1 uncharacterized protein LOC112044649 isoform X1 [Bicyclus anynana]
MARYFENTTIFNFSWDQVALGYWKRYPNPQSTHVLSEDTCSRQVKNGCLYTKRLLTKTNRVPKWGERFFSAKSVKIIEESIVDPEKKVLVTYTRNLGYTKVMSVVERVEYSMCLSPERGGARGVPAGGRGADGGAALRVDRLAGVRLLARHPRLRPRPVPQELQPDGERLQLRPAQHVPAAGARAPHGAHGAHAQRDARGRRRRHRPRQGQRALLRQPQLGRLRRSQDAPQHVHMQVNNT